jgi:hypothetical protein
MEDFRRLEPNMRTLALVGNFLQHWSFVEARLNDVIVKSLGLAELNGIVVCRNIQLRDKIKIAKTAIHMSLIASSEQQEIYKKLIDKIGEFSLKRNVIAHELFVPSDKCDGVHFLITKANGKITFPSEHWSVDAFGQYYDQMRNFDRTLEELLGKLETSSLVRAMMSVEDRKSEPTAPLSQLGLGGLLSLPPLEPLGSTPPHPSSETGQETPPKPPRKRASRKRL